jgi:urease accessory protein
MAVYSTLEEHRVLDGVSAPLTQRQGVRAALRLKFELDGVSGRTILTENMQQPPLQVVRAFQQEDGAALVHLHNLSGGVLGGDQLSLGVEVGRSARAQLTTTGATRIYRRRTELPGAAQRNQLNVADGGLLEYLPDEVIPFAGARFFQESSVSLGADAGFFGWEIVAPGRAARREIFEYDSLEMRTKIFAQSRLIAADNICLRPASAAISSLARLGPYHYWATFYICRVGVEEQRWRDLETRLSEVSQRLTRSGAMRWGVSTLVADGLVVRGASIQGREILPGLREMWRVAKSYLYGREAILPRKVN